MLFTIKRAEFSGVFQMAAWVVDAKAAGNAVCAHVKLQVSERQLIVQATDLDVELVATIVLEKEVREAGEIIVPFRKLNDVCRALPEQAELKFALPQPEKLEVSCEGGRFAFSCLPAGSFPLMQAANYTTTITIAMPELREVMEKTAFAMGDQDVRYFLNGMLLIFNAGFVQAVAADGHRLAIHKIKSTAKATTKECKILVPRKSVLELLRIIGDKKEELTIEVAQNQIRVSAGNIIFTSKLLSGKFPEYSKLIPAQEGLVASSNKGALKSILLRAAALFGDKNQGVSLKFSEGRLDVFATNESCDVVEENIAIDYAGQDTEVSFNVKYLLDFLAVVGTDKVKVKLHGTNRSALFHDEGVRSTYVLMPMQV